MIYTVERNQLIFHILENIKNINGSIGSAINYPGMLCDRQLKDILEKLGEIDSIINE